MEDIAHGPELGIGIGSESLRRGAGATAAATDESKLKFLSGDLGACRG